MALEPWKIIDEKDISPSKWFPLFVQKIQLPNGKIIDDFYISKLGDVAMILPITKNKEIVFVKQYKHGAGEILLELPAGRISNEETPEEAAKKELQEETGIIAEELILIEKLFLNSTKDTARTFCYLLKNAEVTTSQNLEVTEDIELVFIPIKDIEEAIKSGKIKAADTIAFIYLAKMKFPELFFY
jgi:8-oxo-dGTP pyrophosphatase MutT (NUDIX family)